MRCPFCNHTQDKVLDSREISDGSTIRRRRECLSCGKRFTTYERIEISVPVIIKKDGRKEPYQRDKLASGIYKACVKRPIDSETIERIIDEIEEEIFKSSDKEVFSERLGEFVMKKLYDLDRVAYLRFASVYRQFKDVSEFVEEIDKIE
jgi:transcriptional repressor NrdR